MIQMPINNWSDFKASVAAKSLLIQYLTTTNTYEVFAAEGAFYWTISLEIGTPDADDFANNYAANANKPLLDFPNANFINTATTVNYKSGVGKLHNIVFTKAATLATTSFTIYDNTAASGKIIFQGTFGTSAVNPVNLDFHCRFDTGLTVVSDNASNMLTVVWE